MDKFIRSVIITAKRAANALGFLASIFIVLYPWTLLGKGDGNGTNAWAKYLLCWGSAWIIFNRYRWHKKNEGVNNNDD